ncbi:Tyrosine recombinase XerC [Rheinheimera sp. MM224]|nr:Tyrosine recombinase XerC [Rheinheimera sp. MM224]
MARPSNTVELSLWLQRKHPTFFPELLNALHAYLQSSEVSLGFETHPSLKKSLSKADLVKDFDDLKNRVAKHLLLDLAQNSLTQNSITGYVKGLSKRAAERAVQLDLLEVLIRQLTQVTGITAPPIPRLVTTKSDMPVVTASALLRGHLAATVHEQLSKEIQAPTTLTSQLEMSGRLVLWLMFKLGVLDKDLLRLIIQGPKAHFKQLGEFSYYEHSSKRLLLDTQSLLFLRQIWLERGQEDNKMTVSGAINAYLKVALPEIPLTGFNYTQLKDVAKVHLTLTTTPLLARQFAGKIRTTPLQGESWLRVITGYPQPIAKDEQEQSWSLPERQRRTILRFAQNGGLTEEKQTKAEKSLLVKDKLSLIKSMTNMLFTKEKEEFTAAKTELKVWLEQESNFTDDPWCWLLLSWCIQLLEYGSSHKRVLRKDTVKDYLMSLATPVLTVLTNDDYDLSEGEDWVEALNKIVTLVKSPQRCGYVRYFAKFLLNNQIVPDLDLSELNIPGHQAKTDANLLTCQEAELLLSHLRKQQDETAKVARLLFCLGFFCGLRRNEAAKLKIKDIQINGQLSEVRVRRNKQRELKSPHSSRNVPMAPFWPDTEIEFAKGFIDNARLEYRVDRDLFDDQDLVIDAFDYLTRCLKQLTQDQNFRFHHLRHSFANWTYYLLHQHQRKNDAIQVRFLKHDWLSEQVSTKLKQRLGLTFALSRKKLFVVSHLLGHSAIETTCSSYLHLLDVFGFLTMSNPSQVSRKLLIQIHGYDSVMTSQYPLRLTRVPAEVEKKVSLTGVEHLKNNAALSLQSQRAQPEQVPLKSTSVKISLSQLAKFLKHFEQGVSLSKIAARLEISVPQVQGLIQAYESAASQSGQHIQNLFNQVLFTKLTKANFSQVLEWCDHLHSTGTLHNIKVQEVQDILSILVPGKGYLPRSSAPDKVTTLLTFAKQLEISPQQMQFRLLLPTFSDRTSLDDEYDALIVNTITERWQTLIANIIQAPPDINIVSFFDLSNNSYIDRDKNNTGTLTFTKSQEVLHKKISKTGLLEIRITTSVRLINDEPGTTRPVRDRALVCLLKLLLVWKEISQGNL